ncbi:MAG: karyopherin beta [Chaenotheca gracillima]|nr:MAG: karyopherin beta [Chaenotheca gracillima]
MADEQSNASKGAVPKFASFRPKSKALPASSTGRTSDGDPDAQRDVIASHEDRLNHVIRPHRHRHKHEHSRKDVRSKGHELERHKDIRTEPDSRNEVNTSITPWEEENTTFVVDRKGDPHNLAYGTIHRYSIPSYYRCGAGRIVGLPWSCRIDRQQSGEQSLVIHDSSNGAARRREKYAFSRAERKTIKKLRIRPAEEPDYSFDTSQDFVSLSSARGPKRRRVNSGSDSQDEDSGSRHDYRSIEGKAKPQNGPSDRDLAYASESSASDYENTNLDAVSELAKRRNIELSRSVEIDPINVGAWIELIDHQDAVFKGEAQTKRDLTNAERRSLSDIKLSMYEKALSKLAKSGAIDERLLLGLMKEGSKVWDSKKQSSKWRALIQENPNLTILRRKYLDFLQGNFGEFRREGMSQSFLSTLTEIKSRITGARSDHDRITFESTAVYVLLRSTLFLRESGFNELAFAIWQGLLEVNFFQPAELKTKHASLVDVISSLEEFWEDEGPRIGEERARGWAQHAPESPPLESQTDPSAVQIDERDLFASWAKAERSQASKRTMPARTTDENAEDPLQVVFFSDIKDYLVVLESDHMKQTLLDAFFAFCHLPIISRGSHETSGAWTLDQFVRTDALEWDEGEPNWTGSNSIRKLSAEASTEFDPSTSLPEHGTVFDFPFGTFVSSTDTTLSSCQKWFSSFPSRTSDPVEDHGSLDTTRVQRVMQTLVESNIGGTDLAEYYLAFVLRVSPTKSKKVAKGLLKKYPTNLRLYNAYALVERRLGNINASDKVFSTAISMSHTFPEADKNDTILLWRTWIWEYLQDNNDVRNAWRALLSIPEGKPLDEIPTDNSSENSAAFKAHPAALLRAKRFLESGLESCLSQEDLHSNIATYTDVLSLIAFLSNSDPLASALETYDKTFTHLSHRTSTIPPVYTELLHQHRARLTYHHATTARSFRPSLVRDTLASSIAIYPNNTMFLSLYAWNEARFRIDDRVRAVVRDVVLKREHETVVGWLFAVWHELKARPFGAGYSTNSVKAVFERAVSSDRTLRDVFSDDEKRAVWNVIVEKELRIHVDLEPILERQKERVRRERRIEGGGGENPF